MCDLHVNARASINMHVVAFFQLMEPYIRRLFPAFLRMPMDNINISHWIMIHPMDRNHLNFYRWVV